MLKNLPLPSLILSGIGINFSPLRYLPVIELFAQIISSTLPLAIILPPLIPAFGPISTI